MDTAQIVLIVVVIVLTVLLLVLGIQVFLILKELRKTVEKVNKVLDDAGTISESVATPVSNLSSILAGVKTGVSLLGLFTKKKKKRMESEEDNG